MTSTFRNETKQNTEIAAEALRQEVELKAEILCYGVKVKKDYQAHLYSQGIIKTKRFGMARGAKIIIGKRLMVSGTFTDKYAKKSPISLLRKGNKWFIEREGKGIFEISLLKSPKWYFGKMADNTLAMEHVQLHSFNMLAASVYGGCDFSQNDVCKFCKRNVSQNARKENLDILSQAVKRAWESTQDCSLALNTGFINTTDRGASIFAEAIRKIRHHTPIPIGVEMCPPQRNREIEEMIDAGMDSLMINIEFTNEHYRRKYCPGKSRIPQENYFDAANYVISQLGEGSVSSVLIAGLTPKKEVIKGAEILVRRSIVPSICAFRPFDGTALQNHPVTSPLEYLEICSKVQELMKTYGVSTEKDKGCVRCGACSLEGDFPAYSDIIVG
jgi:hypothetical protein